MCPGILFQLRYPVTPVTDLAAVDDQVATMLHSPLVHLGMASLFSKARQ